MWEELMKTNHSVPLQPKLTVSSPNFLLVPLNQLSTRGFVYKKSTVYLNLIPVKSDFSWSENAEVAFTDNSWRTLVPCLSFSLPRVENSAVQTGSRHIPHTVQWENAGLSEELQTGRTEWGVQRYSRVPGLPFTPTVFREQTACTPRVDKDIVQSLKAF